MKIVIDETTLYDEVTDADLFLSTWQQLTRDLLNKQLVVEQIKADDQSLYDNVEQFVTQHFADIQTLQISTVSLPDFLNNLLAEIRELNEKLLGLSVPVSDSFYGTPTTEDWEQFASFIKGIDSLYAAVHACLQGMQLLGASEFARAESMLQSALTDFNVRLRLLDEAVGAEDFTTIGDLITYELTPIFEQLAQVE